MLIGLIVVFDAYWGLVPRVLFGGGYCELVLIVLLMISVGLCLVGLVVLNGLWCGLWLLVGGFVDLLLLVCY